MTDEAEFLERWRREEGIYASWGRCVAHVLSNAVKGRVSPTRLEMFLRIPIMPRVKTQDSLVQKAFYRGKPYKNPYEEIEDKVGLRFVVLLFEDIRTVEEAITLAPQWIASKARDFEDERDAKPYEFDYQSVHYVVRSKLPIDFDGVSIPADVPCEIQIRTLLQHAYSELTHDTIYKPSIKATPELKRTAAKSMALIEATGDYFAALNNVIKKVLADTKKVTEFLHKQFREVVGIDAADTPLNSLLIDHYATFVGATFETDFQNWWNGKTFLAGEILNRSKTSALYRTPSVLLVYFCVAKWPNKAKENCPLSEGELQPIYSDLGRGLN